MTDAARLDRAARLLHGVWWQELLAASLGRTSRTMQRWCSPGGRVPDDAWPTIAGLLREHARECDRMAEELERSQGKLR